MNNIFRCALILAVAGLTPLASLSAANVSWTNTSADGLFSNAANWSSSPNMPMPNDSLYIQNYDPANLDSYFTATELFLGRYASTNGTLNQSDGALRLTGQLAVGDEAGSGELKMSGGLIFTNSFLDFGRWSGSNGTLTMSGGNLYANDWVAFGDSWAGPAPAVGNGTLTKTARLATLSSLAIGGSVYGVGSLTLGTAGGTDTPVVASASMNIGNGGTGILTLNTGSTVITGATTIASGLAGTTGTLELNGGVYATTGITAGETGAIPTVNFNGGTIKARASGTLLSGATLVLKVQTADAKIDTNSFNVVASVPFVNDGVSGLTKSGTGSLTLSGAGNNYTGPTVVKQGQLALASTCTFTAADRNEIQVHTDAALASTPTGGTYFANVTFSDRSLFLCGSDSTFAIAPMAVNNVSASTANTKVLVGVTGADAASFAYYWSGSGPQTVLNFTTENPIAPTFLPVVDTVDIYDVAVNDTGSSITIRFDDNSATRGWQSGTWFTGAWTEVTAPNATDARAWFNGAGGTCLLDGDATVSSLLLKGGYTIDSDATHVLRLESTIAGNAQIQSRIGNNVVNPDIVLVGTPVISVASDTLTLNGNLSGTAGFSLNGGAVLTISNASSTFSGPIDVTGSTLNTAHLPAGNVSLNNSTLNYTNTADYTATSGITASGTTVTISNVGKITVPDNLFSVAPGTTFVKSGNGAMDIAFTGNDAFNLGSAVNYNKGTISVTDARVMASGLLKLGDNADVVLNLGGNAVFGSTSTASQEIAKNNGSCKINLSGDATFYTGSSILFGRENVGGTLATNPEVEITISDNAAIICGNEIRSADANFSRCDYTMTGGSVIGKQVNFAYGYAATSKLIISGGMISGTSLYFGNKRGSQIKPGEGLISGGTLVTTGSTYIGYGGSETAYGTTNINLDLSGEAAFVAGGAIYMAYSSDKTKTGTFATVNMSGYSSMSAGTYIRIATGVTPTTGTKYDIGTLTMSGNSKITAGTELAVGNVASGTGTLTMTGHTAATVTAGEMQVAWAGTGTVTLGGNATADDVRVSATTVQLGGSANAVAKLHLKVGSTLATTRIYSGAATTANDTVYFNGGILKALASDSSAAYFINNDGAATFNLNVLAGGAKIDTNTFSVTIDEQLTSSTGDGGLTKIGQGSLTLSVDPAYNGATIVNEGSLNVTNLSTPSSEVFVATDATLNAASIVANTLTVGGPQRALALGGTQQAAVFESTAVVPEPGTFVLLALAGLGAILAVWRRK